MRRSLYLWLPISLLCLLPMIAQAKTLKDPTQPVIPDVAPTEAKAASEEEYILKGIFASSLAQPVALINDTYVRVGDQFGLDHIDKITTNTVILSRPGQQRTLYLFK